MRKKIPYSGTFSSQKFKDAVTNHARKRGLPLSVLIEKLLREDMGLENKYNAFSNEFEGYEPKSSKLTQKV